MVEQEPFLPIAQHGLIGDLRTCALVGTDGTIDWFCAGRFDSPSVFGSILDPEQGGCWRLGPSDEGVTTSQFYYPDTNVLVTRFMTQRGVAEVHDFMPVLQTKDPAHRQRIVRRVTAVRGSADLEMTLTARPAYGRLGCDVRPAEHGLLMTGDGVRLGLSATVPLEVADGSATARLSLEPGEEHLFVLEVLPEGADESDVASPEEIDSDRLFHRTVEFWQAWIARSSYRGRWRETVHRSALTLKLLTHEPSGAVIASPTTSLPEAIGGERNWDYRYVWIRDAGFTLYALLRLGFTEEAADFMRWLSERMGDPKDAENHEGADGQDLGPLRVLYTIDGDLPHEVELDHLRGYRDSRPVRAGNGAVDQLQLDIYGELIDSVYLFNKYGDGLSADAWADLTRALEWLIDNWDRPDAGMWEIRDEPRHHTTSLLMSWVAIERMMRTARQRGLPGELARWGEVRDEIYHRIMDRHWSDEIGAFTLHDEGTDLDAGILLMPLLKFLAPNDPKFLSTLRAVEEHLVSDTLVFRYDVSASPDGLDGNEGTFSLCSFWYVEALTRAGRLSDARLALEKMFTYANHLGLYAEQIGLAGEQLGNFPQAFTHLSLISAALNLDRELG
ncbi:glycoside hydrolase family 15 protein [Nocardioides marmoraquaticus]